MSETTTHLALPFIMAAQAQKHVTMNEALRMAWDNTAQEVTMLISIET